ncbi:MBL fold metallo-hydrolase [Neptuniibacter sp. QD34_54]|uniref:MBL fold metallo-hydrolase n=1 Tax=Neptuniibacter sp. QD34_54 TaxID=3398208 RepID=UPI0039F46461
MKTTKLMTASTVLASLMSFTAAAGELGVYTSDATGFNTHTFFYDDGKEVVMFDTQFTPAFTEKMVEQIRQETDSKITQVVVTHPNPDKFNGLAYLHAQGINSISSQSIADAMPRVHAYKKNFWVNTMKSFTEDSYPAFENAKVTFNKTHQLKLKSGETISLFELQNSGVASKQLVARIDQTGDLIVGDLVHHKAHAWLEGSLINGAPQPDIKAWNAALAELPALSAGFPNAKIYGGRGEFVKVKDAVTAQTSYLTKADQLVKTFIQEDKGTYNNPSDRYKSIADIFSNAFPDYNYPYMVQYSVYGLYNSHKSTLSN